MTDSVKTVLGDMYEVCAGDGQLGLDKLGLAPGARILDVGTGNGNFAIYLASRGYDVTTGEPEDDASRYARKPWADRAEQAGVADRIHFEPFNAAAMPFADDSFDAVCFFGVLHHIDAAARSAVCEDALRVVKRSGAVVFFEPNQRMLERIWVDDPEHPLAADPSAYVSDTEARAERLDGNFMDVHLLCQA